MKTFKAILFVLGCVVSFSSLATTWDEPWQDQVMKEAESFILAKVESNDEENGVTIVVTKTLAGTKLSGIIEVTDFYLLDLCSITGGHGPEFHFEEGANCYFFIKQNDQGSYCIATPTAGFAYVVEDKVHATYRHSYHMAAVPIEVYEKTMTAIYNFYHGDSYDKSYINGLISEQLSKKPAGFEADNIDTFFMQHVALESVYHLKLDGYYDKILPFLNDTANWHNQISAARALSAYHTEECQSVLLKMISDPANDSFLQVICIWSLAESKPKKLKKELKSIAEQASVEANNFGGNLMDPRVCTSLPYVKEALETLIGEL